MQPQPHRHRGTNQGAHLLTEGGAREFIDARLTDDCSRADIESVYGVLRRFAHGPELLREVVDRCDDVATLQVLAVNLRILVQYDSSGVFHAAILFSAVRKAAEFGTAADWSDACVPLVDAVSAIVPSITSLAPTLARKDAVEKAAFRKALAFLFKCCLRQKDLESITTLAAVSLAIGFNSKVVRSVQAFAARVAPATRHETFWKRYSDLLTVATHLNLTETLHVLDTPNREMLWPLEKARLLDCKLPFDPDSSQKLVDAILAARTPFVVGLIADRSRWPKAYLPTLREASARVLSLLLESDDPFPLWAAKAAVIVSFLERRKGLGFIRERLAQALAEPGFPSSNEHHEASQHLADQLAADGVTDLPYERHRCVAEPFTRIVDRSEAFGRRKHFGDVLKPHEVSEAIREVARYVYGYSEEFPLEESTDLETTLRSRPDSRSFSVEDPETYWDLRPDRLMTLCDEGTPMVSALFAPLLLNLAEELRGSPRPSLVRGYSNRDVLLASVLSALEDLVTAALFDEDTQELLQLCLSKSGWQAPLAESTKPLFVGSGFSTQLNLLSVGLGAATGDVDPSVAWKKICREAPRAVRNANKIPTALYVAAYSLSRHYPRESFEAVCNLIRERNSFVALAPCLIASGPWGVVELLKRNSDDPTAIDRTVIDLALASPPREPYGELAEGYMRRLREGSMGWGDLIGIGRVGGACHAAELYRLSVEKDYGDIQLTLLRSARDALERGDTFF